MFAIVVSRFNEAITFALRDGALEALAEVGQTDVKVVEVPGAWEIPIAVAALLDRPHPPKAIIALGCVIQGETAHARILNDQVSRALMDLMLDSGVPITWGILTPENEEQAEARARPGDLHRGKEAARAALAIARTLEGLEG